MMSRPSRLTLSFLLGLDVPWPCKVLPVCSSKGCRRAATPAAAPAAAAAAAPAAMPGPAADCVITYG